MNMPDLNRFRVDALERSIDEHKEEFRDFRQQDLEWKKRMEDKMDARASGAGETLIAIAKIHSRIDQVDSRIDVYKRASQLTALVLGTLGGLLAWLLDVGSAVRDALGR